MLDYSFLLELSDDIQMTEAQNVIRYIGAFVTDVLASIQIQISRS